MLFVSKLYQHYIILIIIIIKLYIMLSFKVRKLLVNAILNHSKCISMKYFENYSKIRFYISNLL